MGHQESSPSYDHQGLIEAKRNHMIVKVNITAGYDKKDKNYRYIFYLPGTQIP